MIPSFPDRPHLSRRKFFAAAGVAAVAAAVPRPFGQTPVPVVTGNEHWTKKGDVKLFLWEKFVGQSDAGKPTVLFVHGSSMASQPTFDLKVPNRPDSSAMDWFAQRGFNTWTVDLEGYGRSDKTRDTKCYIADGADDLAAATDYISKTRGIAQFLV